MVLVVKGVPTSLRTPLRAKLLATIYFCKICTMKELTLYGFKKRSAKAFIAELLKDKLVVQIHQLYKVTVEGKLQMQELVKTPYIAIWLAKISAEHNATMYIDKPIINVSE